MNNRSKKSYQYGIIGGGISGLQLALALIDDSHFAETSILIIEKEKKDTNDKTLCFWEIGNGKWDDLISNRWTQGKFINRDGEQSVLNLGDYKYKMLPSINFYKYALSKLKADPRVTWVTSDVIALTEESNNVSIQTSEETYQVEHCFDSRVTVDYDQVATESAMVFQPFIGIEVQFDKAVFEAESFTMMDFQYRREDNTAFFYILPLSETRAMIEYTLFVPKNPSDMEQYLAHIDSYIKAKVTDQEYTLRHTEQGMIPMSTYPFHNANTQLLTKIGTAGSWVRPSTGYAFKYIEYYVGKVIDNIKAGKLPSQNLFNRRHQMMDGLMLDLLQNENTLGPWLFDTMYRKVETPLIFKFLDGKTSLFEDLKIMNSFKWAPFFRAIRRQWF